MARLSLTFVLLSPLSAPLLSTWILGGGLFGWHVAQLVAGPTRQEETTIDES